MTLRDCGYGSSWEEAAWAKTNAPNGCARILSKSDARRFRYDTRRNPLISPPRSRQQPAHHLGGVVDHRDDSRVVEPGRADHAEHPDDAAGAVAIRRDDGGRAGQREQLVLRADENAHPLGAFGAA